LAPARGQALVQVQEPVPVRLLPALGLEQPVVCGNNQKKPTPKIAEGLIKK
jgi:hypothetical protein